jgi:hypothetical protein
MLPDPAEAACCLALVLALDVSASVDPTEFRLQADGMAAALRAPQVVAAMLAGGGHVSVAVTQWSGPQDQAIIADWTVIDTPEAIDGLAARVAAVQRRPAFDGRTAVGSALEHGARLLERGPRCALQVIEIAVDGTNNAGPDPAVMRDSPALARITVNALAIGGDLPLDHGTMAGEGDRLSAWLRAEVIRGPGSFVERAEDYPDFERAMTRKLLRELDMMVVGQLGR